MKLTKTERMIIQNLMNAEDYLSSYDIASKTGISRRMFRTVIPEIRRIVESYGIELKSISNKGYKMIADMHQKENLLHLMEEGEKSFSHIPEKEMERHNYIMMRLINSQDYIRLEDLGEEMMLSRTAMGMLLKDIRIILQKYNLVIEQKPSHGITIKGNEIDKRHALLDFHFTAFSESSMFYDFLDTIISDKNTWEYNVLQILHSCGISFTDISLCDLLIGLTVQLERINMNHALQEDPWVFDLEGSIESTAAKKISSLIDREGICVMNEYEIHALCISIACKRSIRNMSLEDERVNLLSGKIIERIRNEMLIDYSPYAENKLDLCLQLLLRQLKYKEKIRTEMWDRAFHKFPCAYYHATIVAEIIHEMDGLKLSTSQLVYLTEAFQWMLDQMHYPLLRVLLICGQIDFGEAEFARKVQNLFADEMTIEKTIKYYRLPEEDPGKYDMVISTVPIHKKLSVPFICISPWLKEEDINKVENFIYDHFQREYLQKYIHPKLFLPNAKIGGKSDIFEVVEKAMKEVYGNFSITEKDVSVSVQEGTLLMEMKRDKDCKCPWIVIEPEQVFHTDEGDFERICFFTGDKTTPAYKEIKRRLTGSSLKKAEKGYIPFLHSLLQG